MYVYSYSEYKENSPKVAIELIDIKLPIDRCVENRDQGEPFSVPQGMVKREQVDQLESTELPIFDPHPQLSSQ